MDRSGERLRQMRLELPQLRPSKHRIVDPVFLERLRVRDALEQGLLCAAAVEPTPMVHEALSRAADLGNQRVMLLDALRQQRGERLHRSFDPFGNRIPPLLEEPRRDPRQCRQMIDGVAAVIHRIAEDNAEFSGKV